MTQSIDAFVTRGRGPEDYRLVLIFMVARFIRSRHEWHEVMMAGSEWLLLVIHTD